MFASCSSLVSLEIPSSCKSFCIPAGLWYAVNSFHECEALEQITIHAQTPPELEQNAFIDAEKLSVIYVPASSLEAYKAAENWSDYADIIYPIP